MNRRENVPIYLTSSAKRRLGATSNLATATIVGPNADGVCTARDIVINGEKCGDFITIGSATGAFEVTQ